MKGGNLMTGLMKNGNPDQIPDEPANRDLAKPSDKKELSFDEKVEALDRFIHFEPLIREVDYKTLLFCETRRNLSDIEEAMASFPEFKGATRDQFALVTELVDHYGLAFFELDAEGRVVTEADKDGLTENEVDDLVVGFAYETTEVGRAVAERLDPHRRFAELVEAAPEREPLYRALLNLLRVKRTFAEVDSYVRGSEGAMVLAQAGVGGMQPSVFVDKLERAGVLFYDGGWQATEAGIEVLDGVRAAA